MVILFQSNKTLTLNQDCTLNSGQIKIDGSTISNINLNGHTLTSNTLYTLSVFTSNKVNISNGTIVLGNQNSEAEAIYIDPPFSAGNTSSITIENITIQGSGAHQFGVAIFNGNVTVSSTIISLPTSTGIIVFSGNYNNYQYGNATVNCRSEHLNDFSVHLNDILKNLYI